MPVEVLQGTAHVVKIDSDVVHGRDDVLVTVEFRDGLDGDTCMVEVVSECPAEGMVPEVESETSAYLVDHCTVETVTPLGVGSGNRAVHIVTPDQQIIGSHPRTVSIPAALYHLGTDFEPFLEDAFAFRVEGNTSPLALSLALATDGDVCPCDVLIEVDILHTQPDDLGHTEAHAELKVDDKVLERGLLALHKCSAVFLGEPVCMGTSVVSEFDLHLLDDAVLVVLEIPVHDVEIPVAGADGLVLPILEEETDVILRDVTRIHLQTVLPEDGVDVVQDSPVLLVGLPLRFLVGDPDVIVHTLGRGVGFAGHQCLPPDKLLA